MEENKHVPKTHLPKQTKLQAAAHDLNNLLNNILSSTELLKDKIGEDITLLQLIKQIELSSKFATDIVGQLQNKTTNSSEDKLQFDLQEVIAEVIQLSEQSNKNRINFEFDDSDHTIFGNPTDIKKIILNLIVNAEEANSLKPFIDIKINRIEDNKILLQISDDGKGIPKELHERIFEKGFSTKKNKSNKGIGLSIVKKILDEHNSTISVHSKIDVGTTFRIMFPASKNISKSYSNKKVLIAEDDKFQREVLKDLIRSMKLNVFTASNGTEALELFISERPDLLFIDESMPEMSGMDCSKKIREIDTQSPIVLVTGLNLENNNLNQDITKVLKKPYNFEAVKNTITELL